MCVCMSRCYNGSVYNDDDDDEDDDTYLQVPIGIQGGGKIDVMLQCFCNVSVVFL